MLKEAISPQLRFELLMGDGRFLPPLCYRREIVEVFQQLFIICDWEHDSRFLAGLVVRYCKGSLMQVSLRPARNLSSLRENVIAGEYSPGEAEKKGAVLRELRRRRF